MAHIIRADGSEEEAAVPAGDSERLRFYQRTVGGYVEPIHLPGGRTMLVNEEGTMSGLSPNEKATEIVRTEAPQYDWGSDWAVLGDVIVVDETEFE